MEYKNSATIPIIAPFFEPKRQPDKKIVAVEDEKEETNKTSINEPKRKYDYDWFEGTSNARYEIDKITGEIDEDGVDKWIEGRDNIRSKIDEKIKKKDKKKEESDNN